MANLKNKSKQSNTGIVSLVAPPKKPSNQVSFRDFLKQKEQKRTLLILSGLFAVMGIVFGILFPYPFTCADSGGYLLSAVTKSINAWRPMGYSHYVQFVHNFSSSLIAVYVFSYIFHAVASLLFIFSAQYLFKITSKGVFYSMALLIVLSPTLIFATNMLMSDSLFCTLTTLYLTTGLWFVNNPRKVWIYALHLVILVFIYTTRYIGMIYAVITMLMVVIVWIMSIGTKKNRVWYSVALLLPLMVIGITQSSMKKAYSEAHKVKTLSAFEGWQWLNNMSPIIPEIRDLDTSKIKGQKNKELHLFLLSFPDSVYSQFNMLSTGQLWGTELPPKRYLFKTMEELNIPYTQAYAKVSIVFGDYAKQLVRKYPFKYLQSYVYPSFLSTFNFYDMKADLFDNLQDCFKEKDQWFWNYYQMQPKDYHFDYSVFKPIDPIRHIAHYVYWIAGIVCTLLFLLRMKFYITEQKPRFMLLLVLILFVLAYVGGSIIAAPSTVWRYSLPFYIPSIAFMTIIINDFVAWIATKKKPLTQTNE